MHLLAESLCLVHRSWYIGVFQWPLLPELMMRSYDYAFVEAAFSSGPMACKTPGAVSAEHIAQFKQGLRQPNACTAALDYYRAFVDSATRFPSPAGAMLTRSAKKFSQPANWGLMRLHQPVQPYLH